MRELQRIRFVTIHYEELQGFRSAASHGYLALCAAVLLGIGGLTTNPLASILSAAVAFLPPPLIDQLLKHHYSSTYGQLRPAARPRWDVGAAATIGAVTAFVVLPDAQHLGIYFGAIGAPQLWIAFRDRTFRSHHVLAALGCAVALVPFLGPAPPARSAVMASFTVAHAAIALSALLDHRLLALASPSEPDRD